jgi:uncharacterized protein YggU (UPF0235/DUF167 family)
MGELSTDHKNERLSAFLRSTLGVCATGVPLRKGEAGPAKVFLAEPLAGKKASHFMILQNSF